MNATARLQDLKIGDFVDFVQQVAETEVETAAAAEAADWFVVLTQPQQEISTVWRLHEQGRELFVPVVRRRVKTARIGRNGQKVTRIIAKPMFPGYGFIRSGSPGVIAAILATRGVHRLLNQTHTNGSEPTPVRLPHEAVFAVFRRQIQQQHEWLKTSAFKSGDRVRIDADGGVYANKLATVDKVDGKGRVEILLGMIRHTLPADMVVAV